MPSATAPDLAPEPGWKPLEPTPEASYVSGEPEGDRLRVRYFLHDGQLKAKVWFGPGAVGPPGHAHGGAMAAALDEAMGIAAWVAGHAVVAARLTTDFRRMLPLGTVCTIETRVERVEGRKVHLEGRLVGPDGTLHAEGAVLFVHLQPEALQALNAQR